LNTQNAVESTILNQIITDKYKNNFKSGCVSVVSL